MRTPEEIRAAKATYDDYQKATETSSLPDGYIVGFEISTNDTDVTIGPGIAKINGRTVVKASTTNIQDMDWAAKKINSTYYYIYLNRYGFWFVDVLEPENIDGKYGLYRLEIGDRYIGGVYVGSDGTYSKVVSHKRIRAEDINFNSITGNEVNASTINVTGLEGVGDLASLDTITLAYVTNAGNLAALDTINSSALLADNVVSLAKLGNTVISGGYILTSLINADVIQTKILEATGAVVIGYEGTGTVSSPDEGDRRVYIDGDEVVFQEYTGGAWSSVNQMRLGGADLNGNFAPFLTCRGILNPLADEMNGSLLPSENMHILDFETDYNDQNNLAPDTTLNVSRSTIAKVYGEYGLMGTSGNNGEIIFEDLIGFGESVVYAAMIKTQATTATTDITIAEFVYEVDGSNSYTAELYYDRTNELLIAEFVETVGGAVEQSVTSEVAETVENFMSGYPVLVGFVLDMTNNKLTCACAIRGYADPVVQEETITSLTLTGASTTNEIRIYGAWQYTSAPLGISNLNLFQDDVLFGVDETVSTDILFQYGTRGEPWNYDYTAKDLVLLPAEGGKVKSPYNWKVDTLWTGSETSGTHSLDSGKFSDYDLLIFYVSATTPYIITGTVNSTQFISNEFVVAGYSTSYVRFSYVSDTSFSIPARTTYTAVRIEGVKL